MKKLIAFIAFMVAAVSADAQSFELGYAAGGGFLFAEEDQTFLGAAQIDVLKLPVLGAGSGAGAEISGFDGKFNYAIYSLNRAPVVGGLYAGADVKVFANGKGDLDTRIVAGYKVTEKISLEIYSLEENRPIAFALFYRF